MRDAIKTVPKKVACAFRGHVHPVKGWRFTEYDYYFCERCGQAIWVMRDEDTGLLRHRPMRWWDDRPRRSK